MANQSTDSNQGNNQGNANQQQGNGESNDKCSLWITAIMGGCIMVYVLICLITFCVETFGEKRNKTYQYSHNISVQLTPKNSLIENKY